MLNLPHWLHKFAHRKWHWHFKIKLPWLESKLIHFHFLLTHLSYCNGESEAKKKLINKLETTCFLRFACAWWTMPRKLLIRVYENRMETNNVGNGKSSRSPAHKSSSFNQIKKTQHSEATILRFLLSLDSCSFLFYTFLHPFLCSWFS